MREFEKSVENLKKFMSALDMSNFCIEVHGLKGSLSLIGASELSGKARKLESASREGDIKYCNLNISEFKNELNYLATELKDAFAQLRESQDPMIIPPELPPILKRIFDAIVNTDVGALYSEIDLLNELELTGEGKEEVERLKEAVLIFNHDYAKEIIERLLESD
jgi:HPt (histidine-containing phosphotransfer) domain-containing protein